MWRGQEHPVGDGQRDGTLQRLRVKEGEAATCAHSNGSHVEFFDTESTEKAVALGGTKVGRDGRDRKNGGRGGMGWRGELTMRRGAEKGSVSLRQVMGRILRVDYAMVRAAEAMDDRR